MNSIDIVLTGRPGWHDVTVTSPAGIRIFPAADGFWFRESDAEPPVARWHATPGSLAHLEIPGHSAHVLVRVAGDRQWEVHSTLRGRYLLGATYEGGRRSVRLAGRERDLAAVIMMAVGRRPGPNDTVARHRCDQFWDLRPDSLLWGTRCQNAMDAQLNGRGAGTVHHTSLCRTWVWDLLNVYNVTLVRAADCCVCPTGRYSKSTLSAMRSKPRP